jgi:hypothetical protein
LRDSLKADSEITIRQHGQVTHVQLRYPDFTVSDGIDLKRADVERLTQKQIERRMIDSSIRSHIACLTSDLFASKAYSAPLGAVIPFHQRLLKKALPPTLEEVAFALELPVLRGVPAKELIALRKNEGDAFRRFQNALRTAIRERLNVAGSSSSQAVAEEIRRDLIEPRLADINSLLASSERTLAKKSATSLVLGALATTCGVLCGAPITTAFTTSVVATVSLVGRATQSHLDEKAEIETKDLYFIWKATEHAQHSRRAM